MGLRILLASDHYPPFIGGAHRQTQLLARALQQRGHHVNVATVWHPGLPAQEDDAGVRVYRYKQLRTLVSWFGKDFAQQHQPPFPDPVTVWKLRRLVNRTKPQIVHSHGWFSYSCAAALLGKDIPLLISARDYGYTCATRTMLHQERVCSGPSFAKCADCAARFYGAPKGIVAVLSLYFARPLLLRKVKGVHSVSSYVQGVIRRDLLRGKDRASKAGGERIPESVIPSFLIHESFEAPDLNFLSRLPADPYILFVGELQPHKGLKTLLDAYQQLADPPPLVLIGYVTPGVPQQFPPGVVVLQDVPHVDVMAAWERCLLGVAPSLWPEPLGGVVYEGMSAGKAVIGTVPGGHVDIIEDGISGLLICSGDANALAKAMQRLIENPGFREQMGRAALKRSEIFTAEVSVPRFEQLYQRLVDRSAG